MLIHTISQTTVGADLSRTSPIHRPSEQFPISTLKSQCALTLLYHWARCIIHLAAQTLVYFFMHGQKTHGGKGTP